MIDPSSSEEESEEDQNVHHGGGGGGGGSGGRAGSGSSHGSRRHPGSISSGPGSGSVCSLASGLTASPGGPNHVGPPGTASPHTGRAGSAAGQQEVAGGGAGLDVPNLSSARNSLSPSMSAAQDAASYAQRPTSPSPSVASEKTEAELQVRARELGLLLPRVFLLFATRNRSRRSLRRRLDPRFKFTYP